MLERFETTLPGGVSTSHTFDLGLHTLEVLEDQSVVVVDHGASTEAVQLDHDESYRLLIALQSVFVTTLAE